MADLGEKALRALDFLRRRKRAYQQTFGDPVGQQVLDDLAIFCRANETVFHADPRQEAMYEGRRQVWLRIAYHLNMSSEDLYRTFQGVNTGGST